MEKDRNYYIDFLKFIFSLIIVCYHSWVFNGDYGNGYFNSGYLAVDFYFIVTGFLFIQSIEKRYSKKLDTESIGKANIKFIYQKIKRILPSLIIINIIGYLLIFKNNITDYEIFFSNNIISEVTLGGAFGYGMLINSACWYISVMIIVLFVLFPLASKNTENFKYWISPLIIIICLGLTQYFQININNPLAKNFIFINGFYKGLIFINLRVISYEISKYLKNQNWGVIKKVLVTLLEIIIYIFLIANMHYSFAGTYITALLFTINIAITFSNKSYTKNIFRFKIFKSLGNLGFLMYLSNIPIRSYLYANYKNVPYQKILLIFFVLSLTIAIITWLINMACIKIYKKYRAKNRKFDILV